MAEGPLTTPRSWILTGSPENFQIYMERGFDVIGLKERRRRQAEQVGPGDEVFFYLTSTQQFGGIARVRSDLYEDRTPIWPSGPKGEAYPWRVDAEPDLVLAEEDFVPAVELAGELHHVRKWPAEHWQLAFQGQLRPISAADAKILRERLTVAAGAGVGA